jgi:SagB-type dehydrogenase family enzyme
MEGVTPPVGVVQMEAPAKKPVLLFGILGLTVIAAAAGWALYALETRKEPVVVEKEVVKEVPAAPASVAESQVAVAPSEKVFVGEAIVLPEPLRKGKMAVEEAITTRRSRRAFDVRPVNLKELSQILFAAQGITDPATGKRAAPSAFEAYPYDMYVVARKVEGVKPGLYLYRPAGNTLQPVTFSETLLLGDGMQGTVKNAPLVLVYGAVYARMQAKVPDLQEAKKMTYQEAGHIAQNVYLATESLGMATVTAGGFDERAVRAELGIGEDTEVIYLQPFGARVAE